MIKRIAKIIGLVTIFLSLPLLANSNEIKAKSYDLKVKLKPKVIESRVYWQERKSIDWKKEVRNWRFGLLSPKEVIPPFIIYKENFYPLEEDYERFRWMSNEGRILIFNPLNYSVKGKLLFSANSFKKNRELEIYVNPVRYRRTSKGVNGEKNKTVIVPCKEEFEQFRVDGIILQPGENEILFSLPEKTDKLKPQSWERDKRARKVSIKFKDDMRFEQCEKVKVSGKRSRFLQSKTQAEYQYALTNGGISFLINFKKADFALLSRDVDVDLEQFPLFKFSCDEGLAAGKLLFGIDYSGDEKIDACLPLENLYNDLEINFFELAKKDFPDVDCFKNSFKVKKIFLLLNKKDIYEEKITPLFLENFQFYSPQAIIIPVDFKPEAKIKTEHCLLRRFKNKKEDRFLVYFRDKFKFLDIDLIYRDKFLDIEKKMEEREEARIIFSLENLVQNFDISSKALFFNLRYELENSENQDIGVSLVFKNNFKEEIKKEDFLTSEREIELELTAEKFSNIKEIVIHLKRKEGSGYKGWAEFKLGKPHFYFKYPAVLKGKKEKFYQVLKKFNPALLKIDKQTFYLNDFNWQTKDILDGGVLEKKVSFNRGKHNYEKLENPTFDVEWVVLEPEDRREMSEDRKEPEITFKKINPTKYLVKVGGAKAPFWLVFSESFHKQWRLYQMTDNRREMTEDIVAEYPHLKVKEAKHLQRFTPEDIKFLFKKPLKAEHHLVNGYANGWYIEPKELGLGQDFTLVLYFWPQSLFYLGLGISGLTLIGCIIFLVVDFIKRRCPKK